MNNFTESAREASFFCNVEALKLELGERNKRLALTSVWLGATFSIDESFDRQVIGFFCCKVKAAAYCAIVSEINGIGE